MDLLKRSIAPILPKAWAMIDDEARRALGVHLCGRKLVEFKGPFGCAFAAVNIGRLTALSEQPAVGVSAGLVRVQPMVEFRTSIVLDTLQLDSVARGATHIDLSTVVSGAERIARAEDEAIFNGFAPAGIAGMIPTSPHSAVVVPDPAQLPRCVVEAQEVLRIAGVGGPYVLVLGTALYENVTAATDEGYPIDRRIERILVDGRVVHAPAVSGAVLMSVRGGDYELSVGQDLSIGYAWHRANEVELFLVESFTFQVLEPSAAVHLVWGGGTGG